MHCFSELPAEPRLEHLRKEMEVQLKQWAIFEHKLMEKMKLCYEMEFPDDALVAMMNEEPENVKKTILRALQHRSNLSSGLLKQAISFLGQNVFTNLKQSAIDALGGQTALPEDILYAIIRQLEHSNKDIRQSAIDVLSSRTTLSKDILYIILRQLEHSNKDIRQSTIYALDSQTALPKDILYAIMRQLEDPDKDIRQSTIYVLGRQTALPKDILYAIMRQLGHSDISIRWSAINALGSQTTLPEDIFYAIMRQLENSDKEMRQFAITILDRQTALSDNILRAIVPLFFKNTSNFGSQYTSMLLNQDSFYDVFPNFDAETLCSSYRVLVRQSFSEQLSCHWQDEAFYINIPDRQRKISLVQNKDVILNAFRDEAVAMGRPPIPSADNRRLR
ncbi:hypothetical protein EYB25_005059 [Talaromyces marneffei]|nr:hypothetical protein EYB25_005059 [Talaromyces marneffei]